MTAKNLPEEVLRTARDQGVRFVQLWFADLLGNLKSVEIAARDLEAALAEGVGFDGSSVHGFARIDESDMMLRPDPATFATLPWGNVGCIICDVYEPDGRPYAGDPRGVLQRALARGRSQGLEMCVGPEVEYFYFNSAQAPETLDSAGYFDVVPPDEGLELRRETVLVLESMGIQVEAAHHEAAPSQHEIDLRFGNALTMADRLLTTRFVVKEVARRHGTHATFMPKPLFGQNGSGMHTHQSLLRSDGRNAFFDQDDPLYLSPLAKCYIAGLMRHAREIIGLCAQWVNSYKRLVPGYEAPAYITWARRNRSTMIRVPGYNPGKEMATRIEFRAPDPACNPYLAFAVMLYAGLEGVEKRYPLPEPMERDVYVMDAVEREALGIAELPGSLNEAIAEMEKSRIVHQALGEHVFQKFIENKKIEWDLYRVRVHRYELEQYLAVL
ncbi:TPA: glutamine synthetase [Candidatus Acetothermia bacterium]|nr:glutamine synthetase [Candidatus Acetothermia bacterium]